MNPDIKLEIAGGNYTWEPTAQPDISADLLTKLGRSINTDTDLPFPAGLTVRATAFINRRLYRLTVPPYCLPDLSHSPPHNPDRLILSPTQKSQVRISYPFTPQSARLDGVPVSSITATFPLSEKPDSPYTLTFIPGLEPPFYGARPLFTHEGQINPMLNYLVLNEEGHPRRISLRLKNRQGFHIEIPPLTKQQSA